MSPLLRYFQGQSNFSQCHKIYNILPLRGNEKIVFLIYLSISILLFFLQACSKDQHCICKSRGSCVYVQQDNSHTICCKSIDYRLFGLGLTFAVDVCGNACALHCYPLQFNPVFAVILLILLCGDPEDSWVQLFERWLALTWD